MADSNQRVNLLHCSSFKSKRVARSALAAELFALSHAFDVSTTLQVSLKAMLGKEIPIKFYMDSKGLFDNVIGINAPTQKRLLIDLSVIRQYYEKREIAEVVWIPTAQNPADVMTKMDSKNEHLIYEVMENKLSIKDEYWVDRNV